MARCRCPSGEFGWIERVCGSDLVPKHKTKIKSLQFLYVYREEKQVLMSLSLFLERLQKSLICFSVR
jgi:hypothetical protein